MARRMHDDTLRDEPARRSTCEGGFRRQLRGFPREFKRQLRVLDEKPDISSPAGGGDEPCRR